MTQNRVIVGTRESPLAMIQTQFVVDALSKIHSQEFTILGMTTQGDQNLDGALSTIGKSLFTKELEDALLKKQVDLVVHSLKDLSTNLPSGTCLGAILERADPRDAVVMHSRHAGKRLADLPAGSIIGTSSVRRSAQLKRVYPSLVFTNIRGNVNTRLRKLEEGYDAILLAVAGLSRMGWSDRISQILDSSEIMHAVGQGALGVQCRSDDERVLTLLSSLNHQDTALRCTAERAFMRKLEGGCSVPLGVESLLEDSRLTLKGSVTSLDGSIQLTASQSLVLTKNSPELAIQLGCEVAQQLLNQGAAQVLANIRK